MILLALILVVARLKLATGLGGTASPLCPSVCGDVSIPYPFNLGVEGCPGLPQYRLDCKQGISQAGKGSNSSVLALTSKSSTDFEVLRIQADSLIVNATGLRASCCNCTTTSTLTLDATQPYVFSGENKFFVNGCNSRGFFSSDKSNGYLMKCETGCDNPDPITDNYCNAFGCCTSPVPSGTREITFTGGGTAHPANSSKDSCGFSGIIYPKSYSTQNAHALGGGQYALKLQWAIQGASSCEDASKSPNYACASAASCKYADSVPGYNCACDKEGYTGDGYKVGTGCADLNECEDPELNSCDQNAICINTDGGHKCKCKNLYVGDGLATGTGCAYVGYQFTASLVANANSTRKAMKTCRGAECTRSDEKRERKRVVLIIGIVSTSVLILVLSGKFIHWVYKLWSWRRYRPKDFYSANLSKLKSLSLSGEPAKLFTYKELSKAAHGFTADLEIGTGGYGTVFKGTLPVGIVAIKKTNRVSSGPSYNDVILNIFFLPLSQSLNDACLKNNSLSCRTSQVTYVTNLDRTDLTFFDYPIYDLSVTENGAEQFLNEVTVLSQVNHRNLVKLLGCCLETEVPMLVYEYIPNGTLHDHLQAEETKPLDWGKRLKIAIETAEALTYLHSAASPPIYHRDVKSTNILLTRDLTVKVTDFGLSRLVPNDVTHVSTVVVGTPGYMDPEYYQNYQLTDRSDVYSFGVVLMELITSLKPVDFTRGSRQVNLAALSIIAIKSGRLMEIVDPMFTKFPPQARVLEAIHHVALLAVACLAPHREQRPSMKEVMDQLVNIKQDYEDVSTEHKRYSEPAGTLAEEESIKHKEYSDPLGILGPVGAGAFSWDSLGLGNMNDLLDVDLIDLEGR